MLAERGGMPVEKRIAAWIDRERALAGRIPRRYRSIEDAFARMQEENKHLTAEQARYLTVHGVSQNEDGTFSWKFDNYARGIYPVDVTQDELHRLWGNITCPTLLVNGAESWASDPAKDGRLAHFKNASGMMFQGAGHWVQHDKLDEFVAAAQAFIAR
jgi:pimeloyl-ACP methyl ester carboxylesterase